MLARGGTILAKHRRPWTKRDNTLLIDLWSGRGLVENIAAQLGRTVVAIVQQAEVLRLGIGCPRGFEYLTAATTRSGFTNTEDLRRVLRWAGVKTYVARTKSPKNQWRRHFVDPDAVDRALAKWAATEPIGAAARRVGVSQPSLRKWLQAAGVADARSSSCEHWRVTEEEVARALSMSKRPHRIGVKYRRDG